MPTDQNSLTVTDNRTGKTYELPITNDTIRAMDLRKIKVADDDFGMMSYDPGYVNTASTKSTITFIDGGKGILRHRGYPIEQLAEQGNFLETAYLVLNGELPTTDELDGWTREISHHTIVHENIKEQMAAFRYDAHPMGMFISTVAALSTFYPNAKNVRDEAERALNVRRLIAKVPTIAAFTYRHSRGLPYNHPSDELSYTGNFLSMMFKMTEPEYRVHPTLERALDTLFVLHIDHEQNCSTTTMRGIGSSMADPYVAVCGAAAALYGPLHGGANQAVLEMIEDIGHISKVPEYIEGCKKGERRLMGFGHRVYKNYDPRATIIKEVANEVFEVTGKNPQLDIALELERIALEDEYFIKRKLYPNVDFYSGLIYQAMNLPATMFPVMFAIPRTVGWLAQWIELLSDEEQRIARPRQVYLGHDNRDYVPADCR